MTDKEPHGAGEKYQRPPMRPHIYLRVRDEAKKKNMYIIDYLQEIIEWYWKKK